MSTWNKIMECVPNFSEGRDLEKIEKIVDKFRAKAGVKLLDYSLSLIHISEPTRRVESRMPSSA
mgnify:CR=1 FL=1